ncbi:MAG TPA: phosphoribosylformylglycinamidine synthase subunit PurS, partial [Thermodesulfobacteriota bacterium]|nr:phosphoribosylformylglycinamidine synthase subunit PurS [Thermodesulfobacteriota bacterium]
MAYRVEIGLKPGVRDARGEKIRSRVIEDLGLAVDSVRTVDAYTVDAELRSGEIEKIAAGPFLDPVIQEYSIGRPIPRDFDWAIEVGYKPGVTDNVGRTAREAVELLVHRKFRPGEGVYTSVVYYLKGKLTRAQADSIASGVLANTLIQRFDIQERNRWDPETGLNLPVPKVAGRKEPMVEEVNLDVSDEELAAISSRRVLALSLAEMKSLQSYSSDLRRLEARKKAGLGRNLTDCEVEALAQTWSEHCKHK